MVGGQLGVGLGAAGVQPPPFARQQVVVDGVADERVPEGVAVAVHEQQPGAYDGPQRLVQRQVVEPGDGAQHVVRRPAPGHGGDPQHVQPLGGQPLGPGEQQLPQRGGRGGAGVGERLGEQRVALAARHDQVEVLRLVLLPEQAGHLVPPERRHPDHLGARQPQRLARGRDDEHAGGHQVARQEDQQVDAGLVGPVQVLQHEDEGPPLGRPLDQQQHLLEQPGPPQVRQFLDLSQLGQQPGQAPAPAARHEAGAVLPDQAAQHRDERRVRHATRIGPAFGHERVHPGGELADQPRLADARLADDQHDARSTLPRRRQPGQLRRTSHEHHPIMKRRPRYEEAATHHARCAGNALPRPSKA
ncbi:hypothetical protein GCM10020220_034830 [Nonomuraea rubra]